MPRIFDKRNPNSYGMMEDDIDSDNNSMISIEEDDDESYIEETYYSSDDDDDNNSSRRKETQVYDRTHTSDEDSIEEYYSSSSESEFESSSSSHYSEDDILPEKSYQDSHTSPTGVSSCVSEDNLRDESGKSKKSKKNKDKKKKGGFFLNKLINSKLLTSLKEATSSGRKVVVPDPKKKRNSDLSDADIEISESGYGTSGKGSSYYPQDESMEDSYYDVHSSEGSHSRSHSYSMSTQSRSQHEHSEFETSNSSLFVSPQPRRSLNEDRRKEYEQQALPFVAEELEEELMENTEEVAPEYRTYQVKMQKGLDPAMHSNEIKKEDNPNKSCLKRDAPVREPPDAPEETPDPISPTTTTLSKKSTTSSSKKKSKAILSSHSPKSTKTSKSKKKKKKNKDKDKSNKKKHDSAISGRTHAVSSRINYAGQICSSPGQQTKKMKKKNEKTNDQDLEAEVTRLKNLVELMMTRMELYERQSECLVETSLEHDRDWKKITIEHFEAAQKRKAITESGKQLIDIKSLLTGRSIQDQWIRQLEAVQRGYQNRLATTQNQLRALRYEHVLTNKQIVDYKKNGGDLMANNSSTHTPDTLLEDLTTSTRTQQQEATTPVMANLNDDVPHQRKKWVDPTTTTSGRDASGKKVLLDGTSMTTLATSQGIEPRGRKTTTSLLEEMIVSWRQDEDDISVLSEKGRNTDKRKIAKKARKERKKLEKMKLQQIDGKGGLVSVEV